jgi:vanillate O-demethylase monooxygenase subunit
MSYRLNAWYVAAWANELKSGVMLARRLLDRPVVLFRGPDGSPRALADRCPYRFAPLSMGKLCDDGAAVQCPYHGLRFDGNGTCVHNPHSGGAIPKAAVVNAYPVVQRQSTVWIWLGDPAQADQGLIRHFDFLDPEAWAVGTGAMIVDAHYELETDNILELSHIEFMHPLFASEAVRRGQIQCSVDGDTVWSKRFIAAQELANLLRGPFEREDKPMIEAVGDRMGGADLWDLKPVLLAGDQAAVHARRILRGKIDNDARKSE